MKFKGVVLVLALALGACTATKAKPAVQNVAPVMKSSTEHVPTRTGTTPVVLERTPEPVEQPEHGCGS